MEQNLTCNVPECGSQLIEQAVVTVCSHAICSRCASNQGFTGQAPYSCPVCRKPLGASEICEQLLHPSEEWKSVALSGLSPTVVMECAGRALSFWSYQMTNQISYQARKNSKLKDYCAELQGEIENIWGQANQRITTLTTKIRDMEREEHTLRRKCEDLRLTLDSRTRELSQSQELYSKLKQRVLLSQNQEIPPNVSVSRSPMQAAGSVDTGQGQAHSQLPRPVLPVGARTGVSNYFPTSPGYSKPQPSSTAILEWNKPVFTQRPEIPATPSSNLPLQNPRSFAFTSAPRAGAGTTTPAPGSGRFHQTSDSRIHTPDGLRTFPGARPGVAGTRRSMSGGDPSMSVPPLERAEGATRRPSPQQTSRKTVQNFELPGPIFRRP